MRFNLRRISSRILLIGLILLSLALLLAFETVLAGSPAAPAQQTSPLHPTYALLDAAGVSVLESGQPVSTMQTCGACHDTQFIAEHSFHASAGLEDFSAPGKTEMAYPWDSSPGAFGRWDPLTYRYLTPVGDERLDLGTAGWIMEMGARHVGGGPAETSRHGGSLLDLTYQPADPETNILHPQTGQPAAWDWAQSGVVEMNCFLCHTVNPNNDARTAALQSGAFGWANTATLLGSGIVEQSGDGFTWNPAAFDANGELKSEFVTIQDPSNANCGQCHGLVHSSEEPLVVASCSLEQTRTALTGQVISDQRIADSGLNLSGKAALTRTWDVHAERALKCTDCHFALNNPVYNQGELENQPENLTFDPRRLEIGEYLLQPLHQFARGQSAQSSVAPELKDTMRRCEGCHTIETTHDWLPYKDRHTQAVACESCHVPAVYAPAIQSYDWTVITLDSQPQTACRGIQGEPGSITSLVTGYEPVLMSRQDVDGNSLVAPFNLVTSWYWVYGDPLRPVRLQDLQAAYLDGAGYAAEVLVAFDQDGSGMLESGELVIDTPEKQALIAGRLEALGLENPQIQAAVQPYSINHNVTTDEWATRDCQACHGSQSRITQSIELASYVPGGVLPEFVPNTNVSVSGELSLAEDGSLVYQPVTEQDGLYVLGHNSVGWVDWLGGLMFLGVLAGVSVHGGLRFYTSLRLKPHRPQLKQVYMYAVYERLWHWLQTFVILLLIFTGLVIHKPDTFGIFSFSYVVLVHNIMAAILVVNAGLSLFYHLASGEIQQFIPRPYGFFDQAIVQAKYYLQGIFRHDPHPFEKTPQRKLNPLQQVTYFAILNFLLPLQTITGILMWGVQRWPDLTSRLGGLPFLAPFHTLVAWSFAAFIVAHVYLTTTGHEPLAGIRAMMYGWDEVEISPEGDKDSEPQPELALDTQTASVEQSNEQSVESNQEVSE